MSDFRTIAVVPFGREIVARTMRDDLSRIGPQMEDIAAIETIARADHDDGSVDVTNRWQTSMRVPAPVARFASGETIVWLDHARWTPVAGCTWRIEMDFLTDRIACSGQTSFEPALGGRGTRVLFTGSLKTDLHGLIGGGAGAAAGPLVDFFASGLIPRNFQRLARALTQFLEATSV